MLTDAAGAAVWDATYRPFGEATVTGALTFNLRFPGQYEDAETGLHYNANRDYDPATGRYIQSDPIGLQGGWNTFAYVGGNPMMGVDKLGLVNEENLQEITNPGIKEDVRKAIYDAEKKIIVCQSNENCPYNTDEEFKNIIIEMMHKAHYHFDDALGGCAEMAHRQGSKSREELALVWLGPAAWVTDDCCTLASTVAHEAIHNAFARRGNTNYDSQEPYITQVEKVCFGC